MRLLNEASGFVSISNSLKALLLVLAVVFVSFLSFEPKDQAEAAGPYWTDCSQHLYVAMEGNGGGGDGVWRFDCNGNLVDRYAYGFSGTSGLAIDGMGHLFISDDSPGIWKASVPGTSTPIATTTTWQNPNGLSLDSTGKLLVADSGNSIHRLTLNAGGAIINHDVLATGFNNPQGVREISPGTVIFTDQDGYIYKITGTTPLPLTAPAAAADRFHPTAIVAGNQGTIAQDPTGHIYVSNFGDEIWRVSPTGATSTKVLDLPAGPGCDASQSGGSAAPSWRGLVFTPDSNNLMMSGYCHDNIRLISRAALEAAAISGTPATTTTLFAQNPGGGLDSDPSGIPYPINGPFGMAFFAANAEKPHIRACSLPGEAPTLWVDNTFTGISTGSNSAPFKSITDAIGNATSGVETIIQVKAGTYAESVDINKPRLHLRGAAAGTTLIAASSTAMDGFKFGADGITIAKFRFHGATTSKSAIAPMSTGKYKDVEICNNVLHENDTGISTGSSTPFIINNTFVLNHTGVDVGANSTSTTVRNNIIQGGPTTGAVGVGIKVSSSPVMSDYNIFWNLVATSTASSGIPRPPCMSCQTTDPKLVNPVGDYHIQATSPALDAGTNNGAPKDDYEGHTRPIDGDSNGSQITDIGADERTSDKGTLEGKKFYDSNGNGALDGSEQGLANWEIHLDTNGNGVIDVGEATTTTNSFGNYKFFGVNPGTTTVREIPQPSTWMQSFPGNYLAEMTGGAEVPASTSTATGVAHIDFDATTNRLGFNITWKDLKGGAITGLHLHSGGSTTTGPVIVDLVAAASTTVGALSGKLIGETVVTTSTAASLQSGNTYVNLHTAGFPAGEIRGQVKPNQYRAHVVNVSAGQTITGLDFGNKLRQDKNCSCIIGTYGTSNPHDWILRLSSTSTSMASSTIKVAAVSVNPAEKGHITFQVRDALATTTKTIVHPNSVVGAANIADIPLSLIPNVNYSFTIMSSSTADGAARHYSLGSSDKNLLIGYKDIMSLEEPPQDWKVFATSSESFNIRINSDTGIVNQATSVAVSIYDFNNGALLLSTTTAIALGAQVDIPFTNASATPKMFRVRLVPNRGHIRMRKIGGPDEYLYVMPCPEVQPTSAPPSTGEPPQTNVLEGLKFLDKNMNGIYEVGEPTLPGWTIFLDANNNGTVDSGEATTTTNAAGQYKFTSVPSGTTTIREVLQPGWKQTYPSNFVAMMSGVAEVPPTTSTATGIATFEYNATTSQLAYLVVWNDLKGGTTTGLHLHSGAASTTGPVAVDLIAQVGASSTGFGPIGGQTTLSTTTAAELLAGNLYVNLHTVDFPAGEIRGQVTANPQRVWTVPVNASTTMRDLNFGNHRDLICSCEIGIFESDNTHDWVLMWTGSTTTPSDLRLKLQGFTVNTAETGNIELTIKDESSATTTMVVVQQPVMGDGPIVLQNLNIMPGKMYHFTVKNTGNARHYKLGSTHRELWIGQKEVRYLEGVVQDWLVSATGSAPVTLEFNTDTASMGAHQATTINVRVIDDAAMAVVTSTTLSMTPGTPQTVTFTNPSSVRKNFRVRIDPGHGHFRMKRTGATGSDEYFFILPCPVPGIIEGVKFLDLNRNGWRDPGDPGLPGWEIFIDDNNNRMLDPGEPATMTDGAGNYKFDKVLPGPAIVREKQLPGWTQTYPANFVAHLGGAAEVPPTTSTAMGIANLEFSTSTNMLKFQVTWHGLEGGTTTGLHLHTGNVTSTGPVAVDLVAAAGASASGFTSPIRGSATLSTTTTADLLAGNIYVNLHTANLAAGEIRGQVMPNPERAWRVNVQPNQTIRNRDFGNSEPDICSCIIGIFESSSSHTWTLKFNGTSTPATTSQVQLKVSAVSVSPFESGSIVVKIKDETGATSTISVAHPTTYVGAENTVMRTITVAPGKSYTLTVEHTGRARHYKLGTDRRDVAIGQTEIKYLEGVHQGWAVNATSSETVTIEFNTDAANMGANQANQITVVVIEKMTGNVVVATTTLSMTPGTPRTISFTNSSSTAKEYIVSIGADGHFRMKRTGTPHDPYFYILPCPPQPPPSGPDPIHPVPGVTQWGLIVMTALLAGVFVWQVQRRRERKEATQPA